MTTATESEVFAGVVPRALLLALIEGLGLDASRVGRLEIDGREIRAEVLTDTKLCKCGKFPTRTHKFLISGK